MSHLPRLTNLTFSGQVEHWPEFRRKFETRNKNLDEDVAIQYLQEEMPSKDKAKIAALRTMKECWVRLEHTYGDRTVNLITAKNNL